MARVLACPRGVGTVALDLGAGADLDARGAAALRELHGQLRAIGTRLRVAVTSKQARELFRDTGLTHRLGARAVHQSLRAAVLAAYAELPGPGLVTAGMREALARPAEPLVPQAQARALQAAVRPSSFTRRGWGELPEVIGGL